MRQLTAAERHHYDEQGFVVVPDLLPRAECLAIDTEIDRLVAEDCARRGAEADARTWLFRLGRQSPLTRRIVTDQRVLALVGGLVGPGISVYSAKLVPKTPHCDEVCHWHQDDAWYRDHQASSCRMSVWLALHDSDEANGGVHLVPGSHRWGLAEWDASGTGHCRRVLREPDPRRLAGAICPTISAGSALLFSALLWHRSGPNTTDRLRRSFIVSYQEGTCTAGNGDQFEVLRSA